MPAALSQPSATTQLINRTSGVRFDELTPSTRARLDAGSREITCTPFAITATIFYAIGGIGVTATVLAAVVTAI